MNAKDQRAYKSTEVLVAIFALSGCYVPEWARWLAQDASGHWYAYQYKPMLTTPKAGMRSTVWTEAVGLDKQLGQVCHLWSTPPSKDWELELYEL